MDKIFIREGVKNNKDGKLNGLTFSVQPNIAVKDYIFDCSSKALLNYTALESSSAVKKLIDAGAEMKGVTNMNEFGLGVSKNTAALSVSNKKADIALVADIMGEASLLSASESVIGYKPTSGIISKYGIEALIPSTACCGVISRDIESVFKAAEVISGNDENDLSMSQKSEGVFKNNAPPQNPLKIVVLKEAAEMLEDGKRKEFKDALENLRKNNFEIKEISFPKFKILKKIHNVIGSVEASSVCGKYDGVRYGYRAASSKNWNDMYIKTREEAFGLLVKQYIFQGGYFQYKKYSSFENACRLRGEVIAETEKIFKDSIILLPVINKKDFSAGDIEELYDIFSFTLLQGLTGAPSVSFPYGPLKEKLNISFQIIGERFSDARLLSAAKKIIFTGGAK